MGCVAGGVGVAAVVVEVVEEEEVVEEVDETMSLSMTDMPT